MYPLRICFEVKGIAADEQGNPVPAGMCITVGESEMEIPYEKLTKNINFEKVAALIHRSPEDLTLITPEEYDERYGDDE